MLFARRAAHRVAHGLRHVGRYYDAGREVLRRADGVVKRAAGFFAQNPSLVPQPYRKHITRGIQSYNDLREKAGHADALVQHMRAG